MNGRYGDPMLPVRVRVLAEQLQEGKGTASAFELKASISNLAGAVTASDGTYMPSLSSYGSQSLFNAGADVILTVGRVPSMHMFGDDELVLELYVAGVQSGNIMSSEWFFTPRSQIGVGRWRGLHPEMRRGDQTVGSLCFGRARRQMHRRAPSQSTRAESPAIAEIC